MGVSRTSFWRRHRRLAWIGGSLLAALAVLTIVFSILLHNAEPYVHDRIVAALEDHFHSHAELDSFHMSLVDGFWAQGKGLRIWPPIQAGSGTTTSLDTAPPGQQPMITLNSFRFHTPLRFPRNGTLHVSHILLQGITIHLPAHGYYKTGPASHVSPSGGESLSVPIEVDTIVCRGVLLEHETDKPGKLPLQIPISLLTLTHVSAGGAMGFDAYLTNPKPDGPIHATGTFGPWVVDHPGESPLAGNYTFDHADLAVFKGIAGSLTSTGHYQGTLHSITVDGVTDTPNFSLSHFGYAVPLHTTFHATVDGTDGDTWLDPVDATLIHSHFLARGEVVRVSPQDPGLVPNANGHDINLQVDIDNAHIEDFLALVSHAGNPLLTGLVTTKASLHIPPGSDPVPERMTLKGHFTLQDASFSSPTVQQRIADLSLRGQGRPKDVKTTAPDTIHSAMQGNFQMAAGVITLPDLKYMVPGAEIDLSGTYGIDTGALDFTGTAKLQATVSQVAGGWKGDLLKPLNHFFEKDGAGTAVPIRVVGTRDDPSFGLNFKHFKPDYH